MNRIRRTVSLAAVVALMALALLPAAALALDEPAPASDHARTDRVVDTSEHDRPERDLSEIKRRALKAIDRQLEALGRLRSSIAGARHITEPHADQLLGDIARATDELGALKVEIEAASTPEELRVLIGHIDDYEIGHVLAPKTHQVVASDSLVYASEMLERYSQKLTEVIARFEEAGFDVSEAWRLLDTMNDQTSEAYRLASPVSASVIGLQAADWPDPAESILSAGRRDLRAAGDNVEAAHASAVDIVKLLRSLKDSVSDVATRN